MRLGRAWLAAPLLSVALLVAVVGSASATSEGEAPLVVSADQSGSLGPEAEQTGERFRLVRARPWPERPVSEANKSGSGTAATRGSPTDPGLLAVSTAQSDTEISPESDTERRLVDRETSERVDGVVIALWSIAAGMTVMLAVFLWHTSPRRRLRLARRRSTQLYDGEADQAEDMAGAGSADDAEVVDDAAAAAETARQDAEAVEVVASGASEDPEPAGAAPPTTDAEPTEAEPAGSSDEDAAGPEPVVPEPVVQDAGPAEPVLPTVEEEPEVAEPELPPVWEDEAEPANEEADPAGSGPAKESPEAGKAAGERRSAFWMQLRRTLGLD